MLKLFFFVAIFLEFFQFLKASSSLLIDPSFLLVEEDWPVGANLPVTICPKNVKIISGDGLNYFDVVKINDTCSTLRLNEHLDADKEDNDGIRGQSFSLVVAGPKKSRATLEIQVVDVNDNPPQFVNTPSMAEISETVPIDTEVMKIFTKDVDTGVSGISRFSVEGDDHFSVDKRKCNNGKCSTTLRVAKKLDYETKQVHTLNITAKDGDPHSNRTHIVTHTITIHLNNEFDEPPTFKTDFEQIFKVPLTAKINDVIVKVIAIDSETQKSEGVRYSLAENEFISIDENSGEVHLKKSPILGQIVTIEITASTKSGKTKNEIKLMASKEELSQKVEDQKREGGEKVEEELCEFPIYEAPLIHRRGMFKSPVLIKTVKPITDDTSIRLIGGSESFDLLVTGDSRLELKIVDSSKIADQNLDNAQLLIKSTTSGGHCRIIIKSVAAASESSSKAVSIKQKIKSKPQFEKEIYHFEIPENRESIFVGKVELIPSSSDVTYQLIGEEVNEFFTISSSGDIRSIKSIDREQNAKFDLTIRAEDGSGASTKCQAHIMIIDENDNSPVFEQKHYQLTVDEGKSEKLKIVASDSDDGKNGEIVYTIDDRENLNNLPIDIADGVLFIGALDRETTGGEVNLTIRATDQGDPPRSSTVDVSIKVNDVNDNSPIFTNSRYSIVLDANISPGGILGKVRADDSDATTPNNYIHYSSQDPKFRISDNGEIVFIGPGTLSKDSYFEFNVTAIDGGEPASNEAHATIVLNEHKSAMKNELTTQINSNETAENAEIKWLNAGMPGYTYEIIRATSDGFEDEEVEKWITIDEKSGRIHTSARISPDRVKQIKLYISMRKGKREVPVELIINVVDTDDVVPVYSKPTVTRKFSVSESVTRGSIVANFSALGVKPTDDIKYSLNITKGSKIKFRLDPNGILKIEKNLDFEKEKKISGFIVATSTKSGKSARISFELTILDANDNRPIFKNNSVFVTSIAENAPYGTFLELPYPLATDMDSGKFAQLRYSMTGDEGFFAIDPINSTIRSIKPLDFEQQRVHSLSIKCVDNNGNLPHHEVFASITVNILDVNDNSPIIHNTDLNHLTIGEDATIGAVITVLLITDADNDSSSLMIDVNSTLFTIDNETRRLQVGSSLRGFAGQRVCSKLSASDGRHVTASPYCVTIYPAKNTHHNPLVLSPKPNSIHYFDENIVYDELLRVKILEEESSENITFKLDEMFKKDWQMFTIGKLNGSLRSKQPFDFEKKTVHEIKILTCRLENCTSTHLFISVNDRNDNCPMFPKQEVRLTVIENEKGHRQVGRIPAALDADFHSDNTKVCYTTDTPLFYFSDMNLPILYTNSSFDREQRKQHQITVTAYDCHTSCRDPHKPTNGTIVALIDVLDVNDNFPKFSEKMYHATVVQGQLTVGAHLLTLQADDADVEEPTGLKFSMRGLVRATTQSFSPDTSPIVIDSKTGEIAANEQLKDSSYTFTVVVTDGVGHEDTATVMISVVTYTQQTELVFDAPFELIIKNEKKIANNLSNATGLQAIIDKCRQSSNFTLMLVHFIDRDDQFVNVDRAIKLLMMSPEESRRELRSVYGLREAFPTIQVPSRMPQIIAIAVALFFIILIICMCIWCRQRNNYERKLRHISAQASTVHSVTLGRPGSQKPTNLGYGDVTIARHHAPPPPATVVNLQSTEL